MAAAGGGRRGGGTLAQAAAKRTHVLGCSCARSENQLFDLHGRVTYLFYFPKRSTEVVLKTRILVAFPLLWAAGPAEAMVAPWLCCSTWV